MLHDRTISFVFSHGIDVAPVLAVTCTRRYAYTYYIIAQKNADFHRFVRFFTLYLYIANIYCKNFLIDILSKQGRECSFKEDKKEHNL